jgi:hypothetical protein
MVSELQDKLLELRLFEHGNNFSFHSYNSLFTRE